MSNRDSNVESPDVEFDPLPENRTAMLLRLNNDVRRLQRELDEMRAAYEGKGVRIIRVENPGGMVSKIILKYWAGNLRNGRYREGQVIPLEIWRSLPSLPADYHIPAGSDEPIVVRFRLTPGYCYRVMSRAYIGEQWDEPRSCGFFEISGNPKAAQSRGGK